MDLLSIKLKFSLFIFFDKMRKMLFESYYEIKLKDMKRSSCSIIIWGMMLTMLSVHSAISVSLCKQNETSYQENSGMHKKYSSEKDTKETMMAEFSRLLQIAAKDESFEQWSKANIATCESDGYAQECDWDPERMWCNKCTIKIHSWRAEYMFHPDLDKGVCTLQQVQITGDAMNESLLADVTKVVEVFLAKGTFVPANKKDDLEKSKWIWKSGHSTAELSSLPVDEDKYSGEEEQNNISNHKTVPRIFFSWLKSPLMHYETLIEADRDNDSENVEISERKEIDLCYQACLEAKLTKCKESYNAFENYWGLSSNSEHMHHQDYSQIFYDALIEALIKLSKTDKLAKDYPATVYWMDLLAREQCRFQGNTEVWEQKEKILQQYGLQYSASHSTTCYLVRNHFSYIALKRQDSIWGKRAFIERSEENWSSADGYGGMDALPDYGTLQDLKEIIRRDEEFIKYFPDSEVSGDVIHHLAYSYDALWSMSLAEIEHDRGKKNTVKSEDIDKARLKAVELFRKYLQKYSGTQDEMKMLNDRYELFKLEHKIDTHADFSPGIC